MSTCLLSVLGVQVSILTLKDTDPLQVWRYDLRLDRDGVERVQSTLVARKDGCFILDHRAWQHMLVPSPSGRWFATAASSYSGQRFLVYRCKDMKLVNEIRIEGGGWDISWSPDESKVMFMLGPRKWSCFDLTAQRLLPVPITGSDVIWGNDGRTAFICDDRARADKVAPLQWYRFDTTTGKAVHASSDLIRACSVMRFTSKAECRHLLQDWLGAGDEVFGTSAFAVLPQTFWHATKVKDCIVTRFGVWKHWEPVGGEEAVGWLTDRDLAFAGFSHRPYGTHLFDLTIFDAEHRGTERFPIEGNIDLSRSAIIPTPK